MPGGLVPDDDFIGVTEEPVPTNGRAVVFGRDNAGLERYFGNPQIQNELDQMTEEATLLGIDLSDPEMLGGFLKKLARRIKRRVRARIRARRARRGSRPRAPISVTTSRGTATMGPGGFSFVSPEAEAMPQEYAPTALAPTGGIMDMIRRNPMLLAIPGGALLLLVVMRRRS